MATKNDNTILLLKEKARKKRAELGAEPKFAPVTTCVFTLYGEKVNIHTLDMSKTLFYLTQFKSMIEAAKDIPEASPQDIIIDGFDITEWYNDLLSKLSTLQYMKKLRDITALEQKLDKLLSEDKKVELELDDIAKLLN